MNILVIHGPNLTMLGAREPHIYGTQTLEDINEEILRWADTHGASVDIFQSNHEGGIIDKLQQAGGHADFVLLNPGAYTHYSYAIRDCISSIPVPVIEVHLSNIHSREEFRARSVTGSACRCVICGMGMFSYILGLEAGNHLMFIRGSGGK